MIFNSFEFIFLFLPIVFAIFYVFNKINFTFSKLWLLFASLFFYGYWNPSYLPLILGSLVVNYIIGSLLGKDRIIWKKTLLTVGIILNVCLLGFYKYYDFFVTNVNLVLPVNLPLLNLLLPLAISFYTFQQIAYLVDSYRQETKGYNFLNYGLFVTFFPQLIAGPIVQHGDVMGQFENKQNRLINYKNISMGLFIFSIGMFKKVAIADYFAEFANKGYQMYENLTFLDGWITSLSYTIQLYFDFSGYSDMAIGLALLFNIRLPQNFNSPYKALSIQDFWRRWHMTLSRFLTTYIYIPLGGNRKGPVRTYINVFLIFLISGIWHGAGWTFILWGISHGLASVINRLWSRAGFRMPKVLAWFITFQFVNAAWVLFRAPTIDIAAQVYKGMLGFNGFAVPSQVQNFIPGNLPIYTYTLSESFLMTASLCLGALLLAFLAKNSVELTARLKPNVFASVYSAGLFIYTIFKIQQVSEFLYFNF